MIKVRRPAGALREGSRPAGDPRAAERSRLALTVPALIEAFTLDGSELGSVGSHLTERDGNPDINAISRALWGRPVAELSDRSELEEIVHLHTLLRHGRDVFVSTDRRMLDCANELEQLGTRVRRPEDALSEARIACDSA
jgi:hypothetical protein